MSDRASAPSSSIAVYINSIAATNDELSKHHSALLGANASVAACVEELRTIIIRFAMATRSPRLGCRSSPRNKFSKLLKITQECDHMNAVNNNVPSSKKQIQAFAQWYKNLMDEDRNSLGLYVAEEAIVQWFGRTIKTKKNITGFIKYDMNCNNHSFTSVDPCGPIVLHVSKERSERTRDINEANEVLAVPLSDTPPSIVKSFSRVALRSTPCKRTRRDSSSPEIDRGAMAGRAKRSKGKEADGAFKLEKYSPGDSKISGLKYNLRNSSVSPKQKLNLMTPKKHLKRNRTPGSDESPPAKISPTKFSEKSQFPVKYMEANCVLEFIKMRNKRGADIYKWERPCKLQIAFSEDPISNGEYVIWSIVYSDNIKCKRNLMAAFDASC